MQLMENSLMCWLLMTNELIAEELITPRRRSRWMCQPRCVLTVGFLGISILKPEDANLGGRRGEVIIGLPALEEILRGLREFLDAEYRLPARPPTAN